MVAILTVSYRHWLEHRGSEGLADFLQTTSATEPDVGAPALNIEISEDMDHPHLNTTPEEMARARPDLTTGELKMPLE